MIDTNAKNTESIAKAFETADRQSKTVFKNSETISQMADLMTQQQAEYLKERKKNEDLTKDNNHYKTKLINSMSNQISSQKEKIKKIEDEKKIIATRAAEYESQVKGLRSIYDDSRNDIDALKMAMQKMKESNTSKTDNLLEKLRKTDVAMIQQAIDLAAIRWV